MKLESKFDIGQKVWCICDYNKPIYEICGFCQGEGKFLATGQDGKAEYIRCPRGCFAQPGEDKTTEYKGTIPGWKVVGEYTIGQVQVRATKKKNAAKKYDTDISYMCVETGVGSGSIHYEKDLFASMQEAEQECETRNKAKEERQNVSGD